LIVFFISPFASKFIPIIIPIVLHWGLTGAEKRANMAEVESENIIPGITGGEVEVKEVEEAAVANRYEKD
jgi:hypothetical protein